MAIGQVRKVNADNEMRYIIEAQERFQYDTATRISEARADGELITRQNMAKKMLAENIPLDLITRLTNFSVSEIEALRG